MRGGTDAAHPKGVLYGLPALHISIENSSEECRQGIFRSCFRVQKKAGISVSFIINIQTKQEKGGRKLVKDNKNVWVPIGVKPSMLV